MTDVTEDRVTALLARIQPRLAPADAERAQYPGDTGLRQPVHTLYVPVDHYRPDLPARYGRYALRLLDEHAADVPTFAGATGLSEDVAADVLPRVRSKLAEQPVEDLRVDFEDGYGMHPDAEEDTAARAAGTGLATAAAEPGAPLIAGVRIKGFQPATRARALRTLDLVLDAALRAGGLPPRFVVVLPKVEHPAQAAALDDVCAALEDAHGLPDGTLRVELQIEVPEAIVGADGTARVAALLHAVRHRCEGLHYGTYDFSAAAGVAAGEQSLEHPLADHAKAVMQLAAAGTGVRVSDGSTNVVPHGDREQVHTAWRNHARLVDRALRRGLYQGWDLHPGHLPTRYAATYAFLRAELAASAARLRAYVARTAGGVLDEPATAQALAAAVLRGLDCGAVDDAEVTAATGLDRSALDRLVRRETPGGTP